MPPLAEPCRRFSHAARLCGPDPTVVSPAATSESPHRSCTAWQAMPSHVQVEAWPERTDVMDTHSHDRLISSPCVSNQEGHE
jgi:hypothetical protein